MGINALSRSYFPLRNSELPRTNAVHRKSVATRSSREAGRRRRWITSSAFASPFPYSPRMSLISDALKKAQLQRGVPPAGWTHLQPAYTSASREKPASSRRLIIANVIVLSAVCVGALYFFRVRSTDVPTDEPQIAVRRAPAAEAAPVNASANLTATPALASSPFLAQNTAAPAAPATSPDYNLAGVSSLGDNTLLSVVRQNDKRSVWVPVGKTVGEITAVSYHPENDRAVIRVHGRLLSIAMHDAGAPADTTPKAAE